MPQPVLNLLERRPSAVSVIFRQKLGELEPVCTGIFSGAAVDSFRPSGDDLVVSSGRYCPKFLLLNFLSR